MTMTTDALTEAANELVIQTMATRVKARGMLEKPEIATLPGHILDALTRYVAPGVQVTVSGPAKAAGAASPTVGEPSRALRTAVARTRELHRVLASLDPANHVWRLLAGEVTTKFADRPDLLLRASDPAETTLFAREVYQAVLDLTDAPHTVRQEVWRRFNAADQADALARGERRPGTPWSVWVAGTGSAQEVTTAPLQTLDTEKAFLAHLRFLVTYSTLSTRRLHKAVSKRVPSAPGHTTLVGWIKGAKLPTQLSEPVLRAVVEVLAGNIVVNADADGVARHVADEHVQTFRMLLAQRQGDALVSGPVHRALAALAEQERQLGDSVEDQVRREVAHDLRDRILAELAADRAHAMPASA